MTYLEALKTIEECAKYLRKNDGDIPFWRYHNVIKTLREAQRVLEDQAWYK